MSGKKVRVLIAEDHGTVRESFRLLLDSQPDMEVVGLAADGGEAVRFAGELLPDVVLMDVSMPGVSGLQATLGLREACPQVRVLALTRHDDYRFVTEMLRAGACGYVLKQSSSDDLLTAVRAVASGRNYLDPAVTGKLLGGYAGRGSDSSHGPGETISGREEEVLRLIARGHSNKEIAARLSVSVKTVETHKSNGMRKLGLEARNDIVDYAIFRGWMQNN